MSGWAWGLAPCRSGSAVTSPGTTEDEAPPPRWQTTKEERTTAQRHQAEHEKNTMSRARAVKSTVRPIPAEVQQKPLAQRLDRIIHDRTRLAILSALAASESLAFNDLKEITATTDGNLSVHARKLEDAGYVMCEKSFAGRVPRTEFRISAAGRRALEKYLDHMEAIIRATRKK
jgi:DNA-binding transcriptional ArsR family regulator